MRAKVTLLAGLLTAALLAGCGGPFVLLPGEALDGPTAPIPESWSFSDSVDTVQLETNPAEPYSVNIWVIAMGDHLYVHAGTNRATWVENMEADPNVRLQVEDAIYELAASRVTDTAEFGGFADAYEKKYGRRPGNENVAEAYLFRLAPR